ncbi:ribonuclease 3 [Notechis scutatus]|uniref:Ribonuclease 3 n=1 Tax=Notechis scutatus TaxID=8663 RepID=A0A6J1UU61_9SAUR|nr:ribonuclease 3 [Notechis scutatus]
MSFHSGRGCPRGRGVTVRASSQTFRPQNLRQLHPQQSSIQYQYDQQPATTSLYASPPTPNYVPPRPDFVPYPPPIPPSPQSSIAQCPPRPPFSGPQMRQTFPLPPCFPPAPPPVPNPGNPPVLANATGQNTFPYMMPPPSLSHPMPPPVMTQQVNYQPAYSPGYSQQTFSPPNYNNYQHSANSYQSNSGSTNSSGSTSSNFRHPSEYLVEKSQTDRRSPERSKYYDEHRHREHGHGHGDRHRSTNHGDRRDRGRSPDRRRAENSRHRSDYVRGRTPPRHRSYEWYREHQRERHRHRDSRRSPSTEKSYRKDHKRTGSRSPSQDRKKPRWEEDRERWSENASREKSYTSIKDKEPEEATGEKNEEEDEDLLKPVWVRCTHSESYYSNDPMDQVGDSTVVGTSRLRDLYEKFEEELGKRQAKAKAARPPWEPPKTKLDEDVGSSSDSECDSEDDSCSSSSDSEVFDVIAEIKRKKAHPDRLHEELWYNDPGQMNDGPLCKCSAKARRTGIRHGIYPGEEPIKPCRPMTNNAGRLFHYRITVSPPTNFLTDRPTVVEYDDHEYIFEGFSMFSHAPLTNIPLCKVIRFNIDYTIHFIEEMMPENFCVRGLELFSSYLFKDILELYDWNLIGPSSENSDTSCPRFHFMPRFVRFLPDGGKEVLSMHQILLYLLRCNKPLVPEEEIANMLQWEELEWQKYAEECKGMIVTSSGMKPSSVRIDQLDREQFNPDVITFPIIVHFGIRPAQLSYAGDPQWGCCALGFLRALLFSQLLLDEQVAAMASGAFLPSLLIFISSVHLYYLFPSLEEGGLATYRTAIVQNQHLAMLAKKLELDRFMLYAHGPDLCRESDLRHAMANCFEALIGAVYLEGSLEEAKQLFGRLLFNDKDLRQVWLNYPLHPLQLQESNTDRQLIETSPVLQKLTEFEDAIGVIFTHVRLLARAFTLRTVGFNHLTLGHNQRMEFLGDSIMQLVATEYLFIHFPDHHEGHLTLLRSSLVNNRTQAKVAEELGMQEFAITNDKTKRPVALRTKTLADLLESFIAALYIDKDLEYVHTFMNVCFFPRLKEFILNQDWNDPKSQLQQCCLTLRTEGKEPDIPLYKTLQTVGPSHARTYTVAVYFKGERIGCGKGPSIQQAEMCAAMDALEKYNFPQMAHQKRFIERKYRQELKEMRWEREHQEKDLDETEDMRK